MSRHIKKVEKLQATKPRQKILNKFLECEGKNVVKEIA